MPPAVRPQEQEYRPPPTRDPSPHAPRPAADPGTAASRALTPPVVLSVKPVLGSGALAPSAPPPPRLHISPCAPDLRPWTVRAVDAVRKGTGVIYEGFTSPRKATSYLIFLMLSCLLADPAAPDFLLIGDKSGKLMSHLQRRGFKPLHESADVVLRLHRSQKELLLMAEQEDDK